MGLVKVKINSHGFTFDIDALFESSRNRITYDPDIVESAKRDIESEIIPFTINGEEADEETLKALRQKLIDSMSMSFSISMHYEER